MYRKRRKTFRRKRRTFRRPSSLATRVSHLARQMMYLRRATMPEMKRFDDDYVDAKTPGALDLTLLNGFSQGLAVTNRIGDKLRFLYLLIRGRFLYNGGDDIVRFMVILDREPAGAEAASTDILTTDNWVSYLNEDYGKRFWIFRDKHFAINNVGDNQVRFFKFRIPLKFTSNYGLGNAGTIADISKNALYVGLVAQNDLRTYCQFTYRLAFTDA